jgi:hypothetical protein
MSTPRINRHLGEELRLKIDRQPISASTND